MSLQVRAVPCQNPAAYYLSKTTFTKVRKMVNFGQCFNLFEIFQRSLTKGRGYEQLWSRFETLTRPKKTLS